MSNTINKKEIIKQASVLGVGIISILSITLSIPVILTLIRYNKCKDELDENNKKILQYLRYSMTIITTILVTTLGRYFGQKLDLVIIGILSAFIGFFNYLITLNLLKKESCSSVKDSDSKFMKVMTTINVSLIPISIGALYFLSNNRIIEV